MDNFKINIDLAMLNGASIMDKTTGGKILLIDLDQTEAVTIKTRKNGKTGVFLDLIANATNKSVVKNCTHFIAPNFKYPDGTRPPICGDVIQFANRQDNAPAYGQYQGQYNGQYQNQGQAQYPVQDPYAQFRQQPRQNFSAAAENKSSDDLPF